MINLPASNSCLSFSSSKFSLAEVTRASASGAALRPRTGEDTWEPAGEARGEARGEAAAEVEGDASVDRLLRDSVELEFDMVLNLLNALHKGYLFSCCEVQGWRRCSIPLCHYLMACPHLCQRRRARNAFNFSVLMTL